MTIEKCGNVSYNCISNKGTTKKVENQACKEKSSRNLRTLKILYRLNERHQNKATARQQPVIIKMLCDRSGSRIFRFLLGDLFPDEFFNRPLL